MSKKIPNKNQKRQTKPQSGAFSVTRTSAKTGEVKCTLPLYRFVYASQVSLFLVVLLLSSFLLQGVERVYANEIVDIVNESAVETDFATNALPSAEDSVTVATPPAATDEEAITPVNVALNPDEAITTENTAPEFEILDIATDDNTSEFADSVLESEVAVEGNLIIDETSSDSEIMENEEEVVLDPVNEDILEIEEDLIDNSDHDEESEFVAEEDIVTEENNSTDDEQNTTVADDLLDDVTIDTTLVATNTIVTSETLSFTASDSVFSFSKAECTELATGSFYCHKPQENELKDALFAAPDADGDLEIFLVRGGVETQVTANTVDDAAPYYDQNSETIVWHRLIDDRYQIVSYDINKASERVLTKTSQNNMEPTRQGKYTVWQRWIDGGWNIVLHDGQKEKQITKTTSHNVAPYIHGSLVVWNRHDQVNEKTIEMYDMESDTYVTVEDPDGMSVSNPRMVFVYDSLHPNGDIVTKGYDILAKKFIDLDSLPRELPEEIPSSDSTGETRALLQQKPSGKSEVEEILPFPNSTGSSTASSSVSAATTTVPVILDALTLDLTAATATLPLPEVQISYKIPPVQLDLVVLPYSASSSPTVEMVDPTIL